MISVRYKVRGTLSGLFVLKNTKSSKYIEDPPFLPSKIVGGFLKIWLKY